MQSEQLNELASALAAAQAEMKQPLKKSTNPHFRSKFADLNEIITTATPVLSKHGLSIVQTTNLEDGALVLVTTLFHRSGQFISGIYPVVPIKNDPQGYGSAMTYARRYAWSAICGLAADDDDDGEAASSRKPEKKENGSSSGRTQTALVEVAKTRHSLDSKGVGAALKAAGIQTFDPERWEDMLKALESYKP
jgi:hypothetical protein